MGRSSQESNIAVQQRDEALLRVGWREFVTLPQWHISHVRAKLDTGACHSAIDVADYEELSDDMVRFHIALSRKDRDKRKEIIAPIVRRATVKSSLGDPHDRLIVATTFRLGPVERTVELGLVSRQRMRYRMLLGRSALADRFMVDSGAEYIFEKPVQRRR